MRTTIDYATRLVAAAGLVAAAHGGSLPAPRFEDVSHLLDMQHVTTAAGGSGMAGAAWFDFDRDGFLDLLLTNGVSRQSRLFRNTGAGAFEDVTLAVGLEGTAGHAGVVAADIDNDGYSDLLLTGDTGFATREPGSVTLYRNLAGKAFEDITSSAGLESPATPLSTACADIDNDGFVDLFITATGSLLTRAQHRNRLYRNNGDATFTDISATSGVDTASGACAAFFSRIDDDLLIDLFVASCNDVDFRPAPLQLFINAGGGRFEDRAARSGLPGDGYWMGVAPADYDNDTDIDLFITNLGRLSGPLRFDHALLMRDCAGGFADRAARAGVTNHAFGWGVAPADFDNDGWTDLFFAGSLVVLNLDLRGPGRGNPGTLLLNRRDGTFDDQTAAVPVNLENRFTSGVAHGDYDNDGFSDVVVGVEGLDDDAGRPVLLRCLPNGNHWLTVQLRGTTSNRDAIGARVTVRSGDLVQTNEVYAGASILSMHSPWLTFGLGQRTAVDRVEVWWPSGLREVFDAAAVDTTLAVVEGQGRPADAPTVPACTAPERPGPCGAGAGAATLAVLACAGCRPIRGSRRPVRRPV